MSERPIIDKVTDICPFCGKTMIPSMEAEDNGVSNPNLNVKFSFKCTNCGAQTPHSIFSASFIDREELLDHINEDLQYEL